MHGESAKQQRSHVHSISQANIQAQLTMDLGLDKLATMLYIINGWANVEEEVRFLHDATSACCGSHAVQKASCVLAWRPYIDPLRSQSDIAWMEFSSYAVFVACAIYGMFKLVFAYTIHVCLIIPDAFLRGNKGSHDNAPWGWKEDEEKSDKRVDYKTSCAFPCLPCLDLAPISVLAFQHAKPMRFHNLRV